MFCKKCHCEVKEEWVYCPKCQCFLRDNIDSDARIAQQKIEKENKDASLYIALFLGSIFGFFFSENSLFFVAAAISIVTGFIRCPNNRAIKVLFWLFIAGFVLYAFLIAIIIISCASAAARCS